MRNHITKIVFIATTLVLAVAVGSTALALPPQARAHAQTTGGPGYSSTNNPGSSHASNAGTVHGANQGHVSGGNYNTNGQTHLAAAQLKACQNRENAIKNIMSRIDTRAQNQINLFSTIATRVENFYTKQGKTLSNYTQLVAGISTAKAKTETDFGTLNNSTFSCTANNPKGVVTAFQGYLKTEISDLQNFRTSVKNLIVGVASVNGVTISSTNQSGSSSSSQGGK